MVDIYSGWENGLISTGFMLTAGSKTNCAVWIQSHTVLVSRIYTALIDVHNTQFALIMLQIKPQLKCKSKKWLKINSVVIWTLEKHDIL